MRSLFGLFLSVIVSLFVSANSAEGFFHKRKEKPAVAEDYFKRLGIERPERRIIAPDFALEDLSRKHVGLKRDLRGRAVFLNFWARCQRWRNFTGTYRPMGKPWCACART
jgi:hypothetical protein